MNETISKQIIKNFLKILLILNLNHIVLQLIKLNFKLKNKGISLILSDNS